MSDLLARLEVSKLAAELRADEHGIAFLAELGADGVRDLRRTLSHALHARHEARFHRIAGITRLVPVGVSAKGAAVIGPLVSARLAGVLDPPHAVRLAKAMKPELLTEVACHLDPDRATPLIRALPADLVVDVGRRLLAERNYLCLGRFTAVVDPDTALRVTEPVDGTGLLMIALYTENQAALDEIVGRLPDRRLEEVVGAAARAGDFAGALTLVAALSAENAARILTVAADLDEQGRDGLASAAAAEDAWPTVLTALGHCDDEVARRLVNVPATLAPGVLAAALAQAPAESAERVRGLLDAQHLAAAG